MSCKYKYNGKEFSEKEILTLIENAKNTNEGKAAGFLQLRELADGYQVIMSNVEDSQQGQGVGTEMYKKLIELNLGVENIYGDFSRTDAAKGVWDKFANIATTANIMDNDGNIKEVPAIMLRESERVDSNGEARLNTILHYIDQVNIENAEPMTLQEKLDVQNMLIAYDMESSYDLTKVLPAEIADKIKNEPEIKNNIDYEQEFIASTGNKNQFGKTEVQNPLIIEQELAKQMAGITDRTTFDQKFSEIGYPSIEEEYLANDDFAQRMYEKFSSLKKLPVLDENLEQATEPNRVTEVREALDLDAVRLATTIDWIASVPADIWANEETDIKRVLEGMEQEAVEAGLDMEGLTESYNTKSQAEIVTFLGSLAALERNETQENFDTFLEDYAKFFEVEQVPAEQLIDLPVQHKDKTLIYMETEKSEYASFSEDSLLKVDQNLYQQVNKLSLDNLYEIIYNYAVSANNRVLPNEAYFGKKEVNNNRLRNPENKAEVIENIAIFARDKVGTLNIAENEFDLDVASQMLLYKHFYNNKLYVQPESNLVQDAELLENFEGDVDYLTSQYISDFQKAKLKGREKNTEEYRTILSKLRVTGKGVELVSNDELTRKEVRLALEKYPNKNLREYAAITKNRGLKELFAPTTYRTLEQTENQRRDYFKNNKNEVPSLKGDYKTVDALTISTKDAGQQFVKVKGDLYEKVEENSTTTFYEKIPSYQENYYVLDGQGAPARRNMGDQVYQSTQTNKKIKNLYTRQEGEKITNENFNCA